MAKVTKRSDQAAANVFTKQQLLESERYKGRKDALTAVLDADTSYTLEQAEEALAGFMKGTVK